MQVLSKITRPSPEGIFPRKRLFRLIDRNHGRCVVFITGPPGSGKTSLITSYIQARKLPCLWYHVDERDTDLATFFYYMGLAAKKALPRYKKPLPLFTPEYGAGVSTFTRRYFETLCSRLKQPGVLVMDNYQEIPPESAMHEMIRIGLSVFPENIFPVIISRSEPPAAFTALQAGNKLRVIGWDDLKLTLEESKGIVRLGHAGRSGLKLYEWLHEKADGWAAGLVLLSDAVNSHGIDPRALNNLAPEEVTDYFKNELFNRLDGPLQEFLLKTAMVPKMTPGLAEKLTGNKSAGKILSNLNQRNYFTEKRVQPEAVYQYHSLFREFLLNCAATRFPSKELSHLKLEAAKLMEVSGQVEEAAELFIEAGAWKELTTLISARAQVLILQGRYKLLAKWIMALPEKVRGSNAWMNYWLATCRLPISPAESRAFFDRAFQLFLSSGNDAGMLLAWSGAVQTFLYDFDDLKPLDKWISWLDERMGGGVFFPTPEIGLSVAAGMVAALTWRNPAHPDIQTWVDKVLTFSKNSSNIELVTRSYTNIAVYYIWKGAFNEGSLLISEMRKMIASQPVSPLRSIVLKHNEALFYNTTAEFQPLALRAVSEGLEEAGKTGVYVLNSFLCTQGVVASLNEGNSERAEGFLSQMEKTLRSGSRAHTSHYYYLSACHYLRTGNTSQAIFSAQKSLDFALETGVPVSEALARLALSHALHEAGDREEATQEMAAAKQAVLRTHSSYLEYLSLLTEAYFEYAKDNDRAGVEFLRKAMTLGEQKGFTSLHYFWRPTVISHLCEKALEAGIEVGYVQNLIRKLKLVPREPSTQIEGWPWSLKIFTLGRFEILKDEKLLQYPVRAPRVPLMLLKALIASGRGGVKEDHLVDALWPETEGDTAHQTLKTTLHRLRQLIGDERAIQVREGRVTLDQHSCWVDAYALEFLLEKAEPLLEEIVPVQGPVIEGIKLAEKALFLYKGPFLGEEANESWAISYQEKLRSKFIRAVGKLGNHFERNGQWEKAVECYQKGLEVDGLAEELYRHLMISYLSWGRKAEALTTYHRCRKILQSVLKIDPSPETIALYETILRKQSFSIGF